MTLAYFNSEKDKAISYDSLSGSIKPARGLTCYRLLSSASKISDIDEFDDLGQVIICPGGLLVPIFVRGIEVRQFVVEASSTLIEF